MPKSAEDKWRKSLQGQIVGDFELLEFVGAGRIGYVYKAQPKGYPGILRAVKLTFDRLKDGWEEELKKVMSLALVEGVVHFHSSGAITIIHDGKTRLAQYTVWDYIHPGENLKDFLKQKNQITTSFLHAVVERILHVLHACEEEGIKRHGDLHAGNILIGEASRSKLDDSLNPRAPIYVSDFGYGTTDAVLKPKDDYEGLANIVNLMLEYIDRSKSSGTDRKLLTAMRDLLDKCLKESTLPERQAPFELLKALLAVKRGAQMGRNHFDPNSRSTSSIPPSDDFSSVGYFQVSEMIGDRWEWWKRLFVPSVPARSKILSLGIPTVVTGPRGCGKTMLFRRLSERLVVECGDVEDLPVAKQFVAFFVNANDFADAFSHFPTDPNEEQQRLLFCYANLCVLSDVLAVQAARSGKYGEHISDDLLDIVAKLLVHDPAILAKGEDRLERYRTTIEDMKWEFPNMTGGWRSYPGLAAMCQHRWLPRFLNDVRRHCDWVGKRETLLFIDDYSTPRVTRSMQKVLNRLFFQRSPHFLVKLATEAASTFVSEDSSGKNLEDGDDYQLIDMGEESLFLPEQDRLGFLNAVFAKRLRIDGRIPENTIALNHLLGKSGLSKTEFARRLRDTRGDSSIADTAQSAAPSQRRGKSKARVLYCGEDVFCGLWSGDTRTMIQLVTDVVDQTSGVVHFDASQAPIAVPVDFAVQDRVFRNRGGAWLSAHTRNQPTRPAKVNSELEKIRLKSPGYELSGRYGDHLKAVVEAFVTAARSLLLGKTYIMNEGNSTREVPRMAFRLEVVDDFRLDGLAREIYRDLVRYGLFIRDSRGKSVRGTFVPRLFLRRLLLPYGLLPLSKRDSVQMNCESFKVLLLWPDRFKSEFSKSVGNSRHHLQRDFNFGADLNTSDNDPAYHD